MLYFDFKKREIEYFLDICERNIIMDYFNVLLSVVTRTISKLVPKKKNRWVFGSWFGNNISDNSRAIYEYILENNKEIEIVWVVRDPDKYKDMPCKVVRRNSIKGCWTVLRSQVAIFNQGYVDFCTFNIIGGAYSVQLWHGVAWKKIGIDGWDEPKRLKDKIYRKAFKMVARYSLFIAPADNYAEVLKSAFNAPEDRIIKVGQPRNDILFNEENNISLHNELLDELNISDKNTKIVLYMPTFRDKKQKILSFFDGTHFDRANQLAKVNNCIIIEKSHFKDSQRKEEDSLSTEGIYALPNYDAMKLLGAADILITDYSSCFFDFVVKDKPIIYYLYDYEYYKNKDRGLYYEYSDIAGGTVAFDDNELFKAIEDNLTNPELEKDKREKLFREYVTYESSENSKKIVNRIKSECR